MSVDDRPTLSAPDDDPWLWLEEIEGKLALDFVARQNSLTLDAFGGKAFERDRDILAAIYDRPDNIPYVSRRGKDLHNLWKDATNPRGLVAADFACRVSQAASSVGDHAGCRPARRARRRGLAAERHHHTAGKLAGDFEPVARWQRRRHLARIRHRHQEFR
ncbi:hypothetical protein ACVWW7_004111 [Bradyrhizobium sp. LM6.9]